ncbi:MAG: universal stress protein [Gammaproteobacteria bacterium]|nr:MAG: universal stress protein [Gammaproteobacteria bacterium]
MAVYQKILVAVDLSSESDVVLKKAQLIAGDDADLHLVYVQEPMDNIYVGIVPQSAAFSGLGGLEAQLRDELKKKLAALGGKFSVPSDHLHILNGSPAHEIHRFAKENDIQLIVIGTHGHKGLQLLLGSTANSVLHGAVCDVLSVRIRVSK